MSQCEARVNGSLVSHCFYTSPGVKLELGSLVSHCFYSSLGVKLELGSLVSHCFYSSLGVKLELASLVNHYFFSRTSSTITAQLTVHSNGVSDWNLIKQGRLNA